MNVVVLAAGAEAEPSLEGYPLLFSEFEGEMLIERIIKQVSALKPERVIIATRPEYISRHHINKIVNILHPGAVTVPIARDTHGAACTALLLVDYLQSDEELLIVSATDLVTADLGLIINDFRQNGADAGGIVFESLHPRYAFARIEDQTDFIVEVAEKRPISRNALAGYYWYRNTEDFVSSAKNMILKDASVNGKFYVSQALNEMVLSNRCVKGYRISSHSYHPVKSVSQVASLEAGDVGRKNLANS